MGIQIQVKCRRCRMFLLSEESIINPDGRTIQDNQAEWDSGNSPGSAKTHLFLSPDLSPPWILEAIVQSSYTQGKILCPKCQGRVGSFSFIKSSNFNMSGYGQTAQPPIYLLCDRVDITNTTEGHRLAVPVVDKTWGSRTNSDKAQLVNADCANEVKSEDTQRLSYERSNPGSSDSSVDQASLQERLLGEHCSCESCGDNVDEMLHLEWLFGEHSASDDPAVERMARSPTCSRNNTREDLGTLNTTAVDRRGGDYQSAVASRSGACRTQDRDDSESQVNSRVCGDSCQGHVEANVHKWRRQKRAERRRREMEELEGDLQWLNANWSYNTNSPCWNSFAALCTQGQRKPPRRIVAARKKAQTENPPTIAEREKEREKRKEQEEQMLQAEEVPWEHTCPMCMEVMLTPQTTKPCQHNFCELCLRRLGSIRTPTTTDCPLCRQRITKCVKNKEMDKAISDQNPYHLAARRREEKRHRNTNQRFMKLPLPHASACPLNQPFYAHLNRLRQPNYSVMVTVIMFLLVVIVLLVLFVMSLAYIGMGLCRLVLSYAAYVFDWALVLLTGERLWSEFMGMESRVATVSSVFVLYLVCSFLVHIIRGGLHR